MTFALALTLSPTHYSYSIAITIEAKETLYSVYRTEVSVLSPLPIAIAQCVQLQLCTQADSFQWNEVIIVIIV